jgi:hypothetical protein
MTATIILIGLAILAAGYMARAAHLRWSGANGLENLETKTQPLDLAAFRNLTDPREERFLRESLPKPVYRRVQRVRVRAAVGYVRNAAANAAVLAGVGAGARRNPDPIVAEAGTELAARASKLRWLAFLVLLRYRAGLLMPVLAALPPTVSDRYEELVACTTHLGSLQNYRPLARITNAL